MEMDNVGVFGKNLTLLKGTDEELYNKIILRQDSLNSPEKDAVEVLQSKSNLPILRAKNREGVTILLHSHYDPEKEAEEIVERCHLDEKGMVFVFGVGLGYVLFSLQRRIKRYLHIVAIEPSEDVFIKALKMIDFSSILSDPRIMFIVGNDYDRLMNILYNEAIFPDEFEFIKLVPFIKLNPSYFKKVRAILEKWRDGGLTRIDMGKENVRKCYYDNVRKDIIELIPGGVKRVIDVGCGYGKTGAALKEIGVEEVVGIEIDEEASKIASMNIDKVICGDVEKIKLPFDEGYFDCIIYADVLEHLRNPWRVLKEHIRYLKEEGYVLSSIPNVRYLHIIRNLLIGKWEYTKIGILDEQHLRFFTRHQILKLFKSAGLKIISITPRENINMNVYDKWKYTKIRDTLNKMAEVLFGFSGIAYITEEDLTDFFCRGFKIVAKK